MEEQGRPELMLAVLAGICFPLLHVALAWVTLRVGWRRGYLRDGLLHGMLLGPLGLFTMLLLPRRPRATEALHQEYARSTGDPYHVLFFTAWSLLYAGVGLGYGAWVYIASTPGPDLLPRFYMPLVVLLLALGYLAFHFAVPLTAWIPPLSDYAEYAEDPALMAALEFEYRVYKYKEGQKNLRAYLGLTAVPLAVALILLLAGGNGAQLFQPWWVRTLLALVLAASLAVLVYLRLLRDRLDEAHERYECDHVADDSRWVPVMPLELRRAVCEAGIRSNTAQRRSIWLNGYVVLCLFGAVGVGLAGIIIAVTEWSLTCTLLLACAGGLLVLCFWISKLLQAPLKEAEYTREQAEVDLELLKRKIKVLVERYVEERQMVDLAFRHEENSGALLSRSIKLPGARPWAEGLADAAAPQPVESAAAVAGLDAAEADEPAAEGEAQAGAMAAGAQSTAAAPAVAWTPGPILRSGPLLAEHPRRAALRQSGYAYLRAALFTLFLLGLVARVEASMTLATVLLSIIAALLAAGGWQLLQAQLLPEVLDVPTTPPPPPPPEQAGAEAAEVGLEQDEHGTEAEAVAPAMDAVAAEAAAPAAEDPWYASALSPPLLEAATAQSAADLEAARLERERLAQEQQEAQEQYQREQQRQRWLGRQVLALDARLSQRGIAVAVLLYPSLGLSYLGYLKYITGDGAPPPGEAGAFIVWLVLTVPLVVYIWLGSAPLYWRRIQYNVERYTEELWRAVASTKGQWEAWQRSVRNRLRLLWSCSGLLLQTLVLGACWQAGLLHSPHPVALAPWAVLAGALALLEAYLIYDYRRAGAQLLLWRGRWLTRVKEAQRQRYKEVMELRRQAEVHEEYDGYAVRYTAGELADAEIARWVELDFAHTFERDPVEYWLDRLRSLALTANWLVFVALQPLRVMPAREAVLNALELSLTVLLVLGGLLWLGRLWRLRATA